MKTRAFKKVLSVICVVAMLMSVCVVGLVGNSSAADNTYTFYVNGVKYKETTLANGAALPNPGMYKGATFEGWYDDTFTKKQEKAGDITTLYAKYSSTFLSFETNDFHFNPNEKNNPASSFVYGVANPQGDGLVLRDKNTATVHSFGVPIYDGVNTEGFKVKADTTYTLTFKCYGEKAPTGDGPSVYINVSQKDYVGGIFSDYGLTAVEGDKDYEKQQEIKEKARKQVLSKKISVTNGKWEYVTIEFTITKEHIADGREYLIFATFGNKAGSILYDDFVITESPAENEITFADNGVVTKQTLVEMSQLPVVSDPNFVGWYDETLTDEYVYAPAVPMTLYAKYEKVADNFEDGDKMVFDPNNKFPADNGFKVVVDPENADNHVLSAPIGSTVVDNYAILGAIGAKGGFSIEKRQVYTIKFNYRASGVGSKGAKVYFKLADTDSVGKDAAGVELVWEVAIENTATAKDVVANFVLEDDSSIDVDALRNLVMAVYGEDSNGTILIDNFSVGPYSKPIAAPDFEMGFDAEGGFKWSVEDANKYEKSYGNGYVNRGELITEADNTFFRVSHFDKKDAYIYFTVDDGKNQFVLEDRAIYTITFKYRVAHAETPTAIGLLMVEPTTAVGGFMFDKIAEIKTFCEDNNNTSYIEIDEKEWTEVTYTFGTNLKNKESFTSLGIYVFNPTNVPEKDPDLNKLTASVVEFDDIVIQTNSKNMGDGMILFNSKGGTDCETLITPSGEPVGALPQPTREGYVFKGWKCDTDNGTVDFGSSTIVPGFITNLYAEWELAEGVIGINVHTNIPEYDEKYAQVIAYPGVKFINFPTEEPSMVGQEFKGWFYDTAFTRPVDLNVVPEASCDIYARWGKGNFIVDFDDFDKTGPSARAKFVTDPVTGNNYLDWHVGWATTNTSDSNTFYCTYLNKFGTHYTVIADNEYTVTFKYKLLEGTVTVGSVTHNKQNGWSDRAEQKTGEASTVVLDKVDPDNWQTASFTFTAKPMSGTANYLSLGIARLGHILVDDIVITSDFNTMNIYGSAIIFDTNGGDRLDPISGAAGSTIELPTPTKSGYKFLGWYLDNTFNEKFTETVYGEETVNLVANWQLGKYAEGFEEFPNAIKGQAISGAYSIYNSKSAGFDKSNVRSGGTALFRKGNTAGVKAFTTARSADLELTVGETYTIQMYVKPTSIGDAAGVINMISMSTYIGINTPSATTPIAKVADLKEGEWNKITYTFTADSKFIGISTSAGNDMYIDDISVTLKGYTGSANTGDSSVNPIVILALVVICAGALLVTGKKVFSK